MIIKYNIFVSFQQKLAVEIIYILALLWKQSQIITIEIEMGQNIRAIEEVIINLQNQRLISPQQSQKFMLDFENNNQKIKDVKQFTDDPTLTKFLKYYIKHKYKSKESKSNKSNKTNYQTTSSRAEIQNELMQVAEIQLKDKIIKNFKKCEQTIQLSLRKMCNIVVQQTYDLFKQTTKQLLLQNMKIQQFQIMWQFDRQFVVYESAIDYVQYINEGDNDHKQYQQFFESYKNRDDKTVFNIDEKNPLKIIISSINDKHHYIFKFVVKQQTEIESYRNFKDNTNFMEQLSTIIQGLALQCQYSCNYKQHIKNLSEFCLLALNIIELGSRIGEEITKQQLIQIIGKNSQNSQQIHELSIFEIYKQILSSRSDKSNISSIPSQMQKSYERYNKQLINIKTYFVSIQQNTFFIDFDRYSELKFCFLNSNCKLINKIKNCWRQDRIKIIDIMSQENNLLTVLRQANKKQSQNGVIVEQNQEYLAKIYMGNNSIVGKTMIFFQKLKRQIKCNNEQFQINQYDILKQNKTSTSLFQQKLVKELQKQDPNLKKTGWLKLFVQQYIDSSQNKKLKSPAKWSVTDIQKVQGIDDIKLNVLVLNDKQLSNLVWGIMKTNQIFNTYVHDQQTSAKFDNFLNQIKHHYNLSKNKYHNFYHAVNVLHMCHVIVSNSKIEEYLSNIEIFAVLLSALCHDVGHTGFSNSYQISTFSQKAMTYNDISPLQNYQASKTFQILKNSKNNFLAKMERQKYMLFKQNVIHNILNTDMKEHFNLISKFKEWTSLPKDQAVTQSNILTALIVRTAAFGCSCKQFSVTKQWSHKVNLEFINQYQNQKKLGIQSKQSLTNLKSMKTWSSNQLGYLKVIVMPMYQEISSFCPTNYGLKSAIAAINTNIEEWRKINEKQNLN